MAFAPGSYYIPRVATNIAAFVVFLAVLNVDGENFDLIPVAPTDNGATPIYQMDAANDASFIEVVSAAPLNAYAFDLQGRYYMQLVEWVDALGAVPVGTTLKSMSDARAPMVIAPIGSVTPTDTAPAGATLAIGSLYSINQPITGTYIVLQPLSQSDNVTTCLGVAPSLSDFCQVYGDGAGMTVVALNLNPVIPVGAAARYINGKAYFIRYAGVVGSVPVCIGANTQDPADTICAPESAFTNMRS